MRHALRWWVWITAIAGCASPVTRAERALERFASGEPDAWHEARYAAEAAILDPETSTDPAAWATRGAVYLAQIGDPALAELQRDPIELALRSYEAASSLEADEALRTRLRVEVPELEALVQERLQRSVRSHDWGTAARDLSWAQRLYRVNLSIGTGDVQREVALRRLASRVEAEAGDAVRAADHYESLVAITRLHEMPLAIDVVLALADRGYPARARTIAEAASRDLPSEIALFEIGAGLAVELGDPDAARAAVDERLERLSRTVDGSMAAARLYTRVGAHDLARRMWTRVIELEPEHFTAHYALGQSLADHAGTLGAASPPTELWSEAESHLQRAHRLDPARRAPLEALFRLYTQKWANIDPGALSAHDREAFDYDRARRDAARAMLDAR